jgi:GNAT superfamily N-acetyltransferase
MTKELKIEKINHENFNAFLKLIDKLAEYENLTPPDQHAKHRLRVDGLHENSKYAAFLARINDDYVGYAIYFMNYSSFFALPVLYLEDIFVSNEYRKKGIGQKLFDFCVKKAKEKNCCRMEWHVLDWNKVGIDFYEKNNAKHMSNWRYYRLTSDQFNNFIK